MIPGGVDIDALFVTLYFIIFLDYHPIPQLWVYKMHPICCLFRKFPWHCIWVVCQWRDGWRKYRQKFRICWLLPFLYWHIWTVLSRVCDCFSVNDDIYSGDILILLRLRREPVKKKEIEGNTLLFCWSEFFRETF